MTSSKTWKNQEKLIKIRDTWEELLKSKHSLSCCQRPHLTHCYKNLSQGFCERQKSFSEKSGVSPFPGKSIKFTSPKTVSRIWFSTLCTERPSFCNFLWIVWWFLFPCGRILGREWWRMRLSLSALSWLATWVAQVFCGRSCQTHFQNCFYLHSYWYLYRIWSAHILHIYTHMFIFVYILLPLFRNVSL